VKISDHAIILLSGDGEEEMTILVTMTSYRPFKAAKLVERVIDAAAKEANKK